MQAPAWVWLARGHHITRDVVGSAITRIGVDRNFEIGAQLVRHASCRQEAWHTDKRRVDYRICPWGRDQPAMRTGTQIRMQLGAAAGERGGVRAARLHALALHTAKARIGRRWNRRSERDIGDNAPGLRVGAAERQMRERAADVFAFRY